MNNISRFAQAMVVLSFFALSGCGNNSLPRTSASGAGAAFSGRTMGGQQPVTGATIQLYAVGITGDGSGATALIGTTVTTDSSGSFKITGDWDCTSNTATYGTNPLLYIVATGGNPGSGANANLSMMAALGYCATVTSSTFISINEVTTVGSIAALYPYMTSYSAIGSGTGDSQNLALAFTAASEYMNFATGLAPGSALPTGYYASSTEIDTLADIVSTCVNSTGGTAGQNNGCGNLFTDATPPGGTAPTDAVGAVLDILKNPTSNVSAIYGLAPSSGAPFQPTLASAPSYWTLPIIASAPSLFSALPGSALLNGGDTQQFTASATGSTNTAATWTVSCSLASCGTVSAAGLYTAPASIPAAGTVTVTATSSADNSQTATATVTLVSLAVSVSPSGTSLLNPGGTQQFAGTVTGTSNSAVTWSATCTGSCGTISAAGLYTAAASVASATTVTVTATSVFDNTKIATATVTVSPVNTTVDFTNTLATLDPYAFGVDITGYGNGLNITSDSTEQNILTGLNLGMMRMGLTYTTSGNPTSQIICSGSGCSTAVTGDAWIGNIKALGAQPMIVVSLNSSNNFANAATDAANMVTHFNINPSTHLPDPTLPNYVKYWVIGNEPNLSTTPSIPTSTYDPLFISMTTAMKAADPNIKAGGPATGGSYSGSGSGPYSYIDQFLIDCGGIVDFVDFHKYDLSGSLWSDSPARLIGSNTAKYGANTTNGRVGEVRAQILAHPLSAARSAQIGIQVGEWNISSNAGGSNTPEARLPYDFFNVLYSASALGNMMTTGARGMMFGDKNAALGILSDGTTPYLTATTKVSWTPPATDTPMPIFYGYAMYTGMGLFRHYGTAAVNATTTIVASPNGLDVFASVNGSNIVVVNKDNIAHTVTFALTGYTTGTAEAWQKAAVGGVIGSSDNPGPLYNSSAIQQLPPINITNGGFSVSVPASSVTTYVLN